MSKLSLPNEHITCWFKLLITDHGIFNLQTKVTNIQLHRPSFGTKEVDCSVCPDAVNCFTCHMSCSR